MAGKISVELELALGKLQAQAKKAASILKINVGSEMNKAADGTDKAAASQDKLEKNTKKATSALQKQLEEWRKINAGGIAPGQKITIASQNPSKGTTGNPFQSGAGGINGGLATNPNPPKMPKIAPPLKNPNMPVNLAMAMRQVNAKPMLPNVPFPALPNAPKPPPLPTPSVSNLKPMLAATIGTGIGGPIGGALAGVLTKINPAVAAVTAAMTALRFAAIQVAASFERAREIYAKTIQSGFGLKMQATRGMLANIIGVSENEIFQYGAAIARLSEKIQVARNVIVQTNPILTQVAWNFSVLKMNFQAVFDTLAAAIAPALNRLMEFVSAMLKLEVLSGVVTIIGDAIGMVIDSFTRLIATMEIIPAAVLTAMTLIKDAVTNILANINNIFADSRLGKMAGMQHKKAPGFQDSKNAIQALKEVIDAAIGGPNKEKAPNPQAFMKQMPASSWERMGLQVGAGGGTNYAQQTAKNTAKNASISDMILKAVQANKFNVTKPNAIPSGA